MSNNLENDRSVPPGKMYPIDLAPQKITIVKSVSNAEVKMTHILPGQPKTTSQIISHAGPVGLMRPTAQIITPGVASQPQMIVSGSPMLQGTQIVSQGSQLIGQSSQIISQPTQLIGPSGQLISPGTQIISQGTQLTAQVSAANNTGNTNVQTTVAPVSGAQVLSVGGQLVSGTGNLLVSSTVRALTPSVRVLPPLPHHNARPAVLSTVNVSTASGVLVGKGVTHHVPRGLAAGASLAVRPVTPSVQSVQGGQWAGTRARGALVYGAARAATPPRAASQRPAAPSAPPPAPALSPAPISAIVTLATTAVLPSSGVISSTVRSTTPRPATSVATPQRPLALLQRNYQPAKVLGVSTVGGMSVGVRGSVGNSAPAQLYYEVPRAAARPLAPYHTQPHQGTTVNIVNQVQPLAEPQVQSGPIMPRPSILRKREVEGSPSKNASSMSVYRSEGGSVTSLGSSVTSLGGCVTSSAATGVTVVPAVPDGGGGGWEDVPTGGGVGGSGGSTTVSAASSPAPDDDQDVPRVEEISPRKKPRKQILVPERRECERNEEERRESGWSGGGGGAGGGGKRPLLSSQFVCGWRATALHFSRPSDVRRREPRRAPPKIARARADGWKVHHLTAQMDDLVSLEADVGEQLEGVLQALENATSRANAALQAHSHNLLELLKGNIQRSKIVCEGIQEARMDILNVFTHKNFVTEILSRQADKRCFRKHRSQS